MNEKEALSQKLLEEAFNLKCANKLGPAAVKVKEAIDIDPDGKMLGQHYYLIGELFYLNGNYESSYASYMCTIIELGTASTVLVDGYGSYVDCVKNGRTANMPVEAQRFIALANGMGCDIGHAILDKANAHSRRTAIQNYQKNLLARNIYEIAYEKDFPETDKEYDLECRTAGMKRICNMIECFADGSWRSRYDTYLAEAKKIS